MENETEQLIAELFVDFDFKLIDLNTKLIVEGEEIGEIDSILEFSDWFFY